METTQPLLAFLIGVEAQNRFSARGIMGRSDRAVVIKACKRF
jgi:hypothetical protein